MPDPWKCARCGAPMHRELDAPTQRQLDQINARGARQRTAIIHVCGRCDAMHFATEGGGLRPLTPAEELDVRVAIPRTVDALPAVRTITSWLGGDAAAGTLILGTE